MRAVLDTSVVVATNVPPIPGELAVSAATLAELHYGVLVARDTAWRAERLRRLAQVERLFDLLPVNEAVARSYGQLAAAADAIGRKPRARAMDILIAATAHANGARLYTRNAADLRGLGNLVDIVSV